MNNTTANIKHYIEESENMIQGVIRRKYCIEEYNENSWEDVVNRFKKGLEEDYEKGILKYDIAEVIANRMLEKKFLPAGSVLYGYKNPGNVSLGNCAFKSIEGDSLEDIFNYCKYSARMFSWRMGVGTDISVLRPKDAKVNNAARSSTGSVSFMPLISTATNTIGQNGRRGASIITEHVFHPDILYFIDSKAYPDKVFEYDPLNDHLPQVHYANISVKVSDRFMEAVVNDEEWEFVFPDIDADKEKYEKEWKGDIEEWIKGGGKIKVYGKAKARDVLKKIAHSAWKIGDPGLLYWDRCVKYSSTYFDERIRVKGVNPCLTGDTNVWVLDDDKHILFKLPIKDLIVINKYYPEKFKILSYSFRNELPVFRKIEKVILTKKDAEVIEITLANGRKLKLTPDHPVYDPQTKKWKDASDFKEGDKILYYDYETKIEPDLIEITKITPAGREDVFDITVEDTHNFFANGILVHNCGEQTLTEYGVCLLLGIVLYKYVVNPYEKDAYFDFDAFMKDIEYYVKFADYLIDVGKHPFKEQKDVELYGRKFGLEILGLADMFAMLGMEYDSDETLNFAQTLMRKMHKAIIETSINISKDLGPAPALTSKESRKAFLKQEYIQFIINDVFDEKADDIMDDILKYGMRNTAFTTIGPTGSLALIADNCSSGIEPVFVFSYERSVRTEEGVKKYDVIHLPLMKYLERTNQLHLLDELSIEELKKRFHYKTAYEIDWRKRVELQGLLQRYISDSISSTINLPEDIDEDTIYQIYLEGWKKGLKGITVYRDGSKSNVIKAKDNKEDKKNDKEEYENPDTGIDVLLKDNNHVIIKGTLEEEEAKIFKVIWTQGVTVRLSVTLDNDTPLEILPIVPPGVGKVQPTEMDLIEKKAEWNAILKLIKLALERGLPVEEIMYQLNKAKLDDNTISDLVLRYIYYNGIRSFLELKYDKIYEVPKPILQKLNGDHFSGKYNKNLYLKRKSGWVVVCRFVSILLRADTPLIEVIKVLDSSALNMFTVPALISKTLKKFLNTENDVNELIEMYNEGHKDVGEVCPECGEKALIFVGGCNQCLSCGYSKC